MSEKFLYGFFDMRGNFTTGWIESQSIMNGGSLTKPVKWLSSRSSI